MPAGVDLVAGGNSVVYLGPTQPVENALGLNVAGLRVAQGGLIVDGIWRNDPGIDPDKPWALWSGGLPPPLRGFDMLESGAAYFFLATAPGTLSFAAAPPPCTLCQDPPTVGGEDYGDAPASYEAGGAAFHTPEDGFFLGATGWTWKVARSHRQTSAVATWAMATATARRRRCSRRRTMRMGWSF